MRIKRQTNTIGLFPYQGEAFNSKKQFILVCAGVQSGKTFLGSAWIRSKISEFPGENGLISAPTYKVLNQSTLDKFFQLFPEFRMFYKEQKQVIELPEGGKIFVRSADQPLGIEGMTIRYGWLDEYGQAPRLAWTVCKSRVSMTSGQLMITTTPYAMNWLFEEVYLPWFNKKDERVSFHSWESIANPYFSRDHFHAEEKALSKEEFDRRYRGKFTRMAGLVYDDFTNDLIGEPDSTKIVQSFIGLDFGFTNPAAIEVIRVDKEGHMWIVDEWYEEGKTQDEINEACKFFKGRYNTNIFYPDVAEPDRIISMQRAGLAARESNKDVVYGTDKVREGFRLKKLHISPRCKNLIDEIQT